MPRKFSYPNKLNLESLMKVTLLHCIFLVIFSVMGRAQNWSEIVKLETSDQELDDNHAISVAISGDYAIAGAWHEDHDGAGGSTLDDAGAAYVYHYDAGTEEWTEEAKLVAADRESGDVFGISVDISGTYAVIGAVEENGAQGARAARPRLCQRGRPRIQGALDGCLSERRKTVGGVHEQQRLRRAPLCLVELQRRLPIGFDAGA